MVLKAAIGNAIRFGVREAERCRVAPGNERSIAPWPVTVKTLLWTSETSIRTARAQLRSCVEGTQQRSAPKGHGSVPIA